MSPNPTYALLFGAGASYGSGDVTPRPPPLAADLLVPLKRLFPTIWGALAPEHEAALANDFEAGMKMLGEQQSHYLPPLQRALASFFFDFVPGRDNLYRKLARRIKGSDWPGILISLNYERLLELSLLLEGIAPFCGSPPDAKSSVELCLPHGCCHLFCEAARGSAANMSFSGPSVTTRGPVICIPDRREYCHRIKTDAFPPVMSYFDASKGTTSGANFIEDQRARYTQVVQSASTIVIVGVRARPHDRHLWEALAATDAELVYCSGGKAGQEFEEWAHHEREGKVSLALSGYFAECFEELCARVDLHG